MQHILRRRPVGAEEIESIEVEIPDFLDRHGAVHAPQTGLEAKYSLEYDLAAIALDGTGRHPPVHRRGGADARWRSRSCSG